MKKDEIQLMENPSKRVYHLTTTNENLDNTCKNTLKGPRYYAH